MNLEFTEFMEDSCLALAREVPEFPTQMGLFEIAGEPVPQNYFTAIDADSVDQRQNLLQSIREKLSQFQRTQLDSSEKLSADILDFSVKRVYERGLIGTAGKDFLQHEYLIRPSVGLQSDLPIFLTDLHPMRHVQDAEDYLSRLKSIASHLIDADQQIRHRQSAGLLPPALVLRDSIEEIEKFTAVRVKENILYTSLAEKSANLQGLEEPGRKALLDEASTELEKNTYPAYHQLLKTIKEQETQASDVPGVWHLPDGDAWYEFQLQAATTTSLNAAEIHEMGLEETHKLEQEIIQACRDIGIQANTITDCHHHLNADRPPDNKDTEQNRQAIVDQVKTIMMEIEAQLPDLFHHLPHGEITVKTIPRFAEANRNQSYQPPSLDGSRAGFFELNVGQLLSEASFELPILVYHEIFPGHHLQIALAGEDESLPSLRRIITFDAYIEGWAKYAETIPERHGINNDPRFRIARMRRELMSTINLALDTGIHAKRWSTEQAVRFFDQHSGAGETFSRYIVHRSASVPAQMCSYKIGMMKMLELRKKMENALKDRFDVRDFHHTVLSRGSVPLALLDSIVDQDIERLRRSP